MLDSTSLRNRIRVSARTGGGLSSELTGMKVAHARADGLRRRKSTTGRIHFDTRWGERVIWWKSDDSPVLSAEEWSVRWSAQYVVPFKNAVGADACVSRLTYS